MEEFLENPSERSAKFMLDSLGLQGVIDKCSDEEKSSEILKLLFQLNGFNLFTQIGTEGVIHLLQYKFIQSQILAHLNALEFPDADYEAFISEIFSLVSAEDVGPAILAIDLLLNKLSHIVCKEKYVAEFKKVLVAEDSVVKIRGLELVVKLANKNPDFFDFLDFHGIIDSGISMATGEDILLRIVALEVVSELSSSEKGNQKLMENRVKTSILAVVDFDNDPHTREIVYKIYGINENFEDQN